MFGTLDKVHLHRDAVRGGHQLDLHPVEVFPFRCVATPVPLVPEQLATAYTYVVAGLYRKRTDDVFHLAAHVPGYPADTQQNEHQGFLQLVEAFGETAPFGHTIENMAAHIGQRHCPVPTETKGRDQCRGDHLSIGGFPVIVFLMVHSLQ
ncbi:MAG: hypothetical protein CR994_02350 [Maribacter sp.]|nr:MAG: hypothetical protein CR994_02350 [Maribacter sp.]